jgi:dTDP-4-dehydrorhamnose reductase
LSDWIVASARSGATITVFDDVRFTPLSMTTLAESIGKVAAAPVAGVFNLGSSDGMTKADFAFALVESLGLPADNMRRGSVNDAPRTARRPRDMRMSSARFHATFGGTAPNLLDEIHRCAEEYR